MTQADGSGFKELPVATDLSSSVDWSPDSSQIVYVADEEPEDRVRVAPSDASGAGHLVPMPEGWIGPHNPTFSPDGTRVAFDARPDTSEGNEQVLVGPTDGSAPAGPITKSSMNNEQPDWKPCEGCAPPGKPQNPGNGGGQPTKTPTKVRTVSFKNIYVYPRMAVGINCFADGGHPDPKYCNGDGIAKMVAPGGGFLRSPKHELKRRMKTIVFAKGSVKVPGGESKPLKLKVTAAGKKLAKPGKTLKILLDIKVSRDQEKPETFKKTVKIKVPKKK